ncbi:MAG: FAD-binding oxidoreductase [Hyphomicrobiales bacterium]|nr:FAD-binding oxidoreductase [Hyphomicrobiales bacterium]MCP5001858.1 FAD-binding oxidoreductase [Hyphomicrobiales bacterium]
MDNYKHRPFWWDEAGLEARELAEGAADLPDKADILVVGAGYTGLSAALTLARGGREVVVVDADMPGYGCSGRNGGLIGPSFHKLGLSGLTAAYGSERANAILRESMDSLDFLKNLIKTEGIDCGLKADGRFRGAVRPRAYDTLLREAESLHKSVGLRFEPVPKSEQHRQIGSDYYHGGIVLPDDGHLQPAALVIGLCERARQSGARVFAPARVTGLQRESHGFSVQISDRLIHADQVLIATNGYTGAELSYFHKRVIPIRSAIIATEELDPQIITELSPKGLGYGDSDRLVIYYRPSPDGKRMIFGGRVFDRADRPDKYSTDLKRLMTRIFPQLSGVGITHAWSGTVAYTFDHAPHLGEHDGIHYAMGYCGSGVGRANYFGHKIALKLLGSRDGKTALDGLDFKTHPLYTGSTWFMPAILRWHAIADRMGL